MGWDVSEIYIVIIYIIDIYLFSDNRVIVDLDGRVIGGLVAKPTHDWQQVHDEAFQAMKMASEETTGLCKKCDRKPWQEWKDCKTYKNRRGDYKAISVGLSHGNGHTVCSICDTK